MLPLSTVVPAERAANAAARFSLTWPHRLRRSSLARCSLSSWSTGGWDRSRCGMLVHVLSCTTATSTLAGDFVRCLGAGERSVGCSKETCCPWCSS